MRMYDNKLLAERRYSSCKSLAKRHSSVTKDILYQRSGGVTIIFHNITSEAAKSKFLTFQSFCVHEMTDSGEVTCATCPNNRTVITGGTNTVYFFKSILKDIETNSEFIGRFCLGNFASHNSHNAHFFSSTKGVVRSYRTCNVCSCFGQFWVRFQDVRGPGTAARSVARYRAGA